MNVWCARDPMGSVMPLTLITGPANAAKAGAVLERFRAALPREPVLVVPTPADVEHYQRELAAEGIVVGTEVADLLVARAFDRRGDGGDLAGARPGRARARRARRRGGRAARGAGPLGRGSGLRGRRRRAVRRARALAGDPGALRGAVRDWDEAPAHAGELAALYSAYHRRLERLGAVDSEGLARAALDGLRERPDRVGRSPVFLYGFDDLTPLQRDAVETLARHADVCVALAYEPGRAAFAGRAATVELLKPLAERHELLEDRSEHYAANARDALHHLERGLFEPAPGGGRRTGRCGCWRRAASAPRRSWSPPRSSS